MSMNYTSTTNVESKHVGLFGFLSRAKEASVTL